MSLKDTIELWSKGVDKALEDKFQDAIDVWTSMQEPGARIFFNIASMHLFLGNIDNAERNLDLAVKKDSHLALAYFQRGCLKLQTKNYSEALDDLDSAIKNLRGNLFIDYKQLGLQYKLYSCEVMFNHACVLNCMGQASEAKEELDRAKTIAAGSTESRHKIITAGLESLKTSGKFEPYSLPDNAMVFQPPRQKTEVLKPTNFLGKAKVLASVVDQDSYVGFVGVQEERKRQARSPSPRQGSNQALPSRPSEPPPSVKPVKPASPAPTRVSKPDAPPPVPSMKIMSRTQSLLKQSGGSQTSKSSVKSMTSEFKKVDVQGRPPKPSKAPPPLKLDKKSDKSPVGARKSLETSGNKIKSPISPSKSPIGRARSPVSPSRSPIDGSRSPVSPSRSPVSRSKSSDTGAKKKPAMMTIKVHYTTTRALRVSSSITYQQLQNLICKKFDCPADSLTLWSKKKNGDLSEIESDQTFKDVSAALDDGFRLTLWAYDKDEEAEVESGSDDVVLMECEAVHGYEGQYEDELTFQAGDKVDVIVEINEEWYQGRCNGRTGIFPKSYVKAKEPAA